MKKVIIIVISFLLLISIGCIEPIKPTYNRSPYNPEDAIKNGDVVNVQGQEYNAEKLDQFMENIKNNKNDKIRITMYTIEGDPILIDLEYDGKRIFYTYDNTRDGFGSPTIEKKMFSADKLYKLGREYYIKNFPEDIFIYSWDI